MRYLKAVLILFVISLVILATVGAIKAETPRDISEEWIGDEMLGWTRVENMGPPCAWEQWFWDHIYMSFSNWLGSTIWGWDMPQTIDIPPVSENGEEYMDNGRWMW